MADGLFDFHGDIVGSIKKYEHAEVHLDLPRLWKERLFLEFSSQYGNYPQEDFLGIGTQLDRESPHEFSTGACGL